jgi:hypothetical protein
MFSIELRRSESCFSGHERWTLHDLDLSAADTALGELLDCIERDVGHGSRLSGYLHPLNTQAICECGESRMAVGTDWATPPTCDRCGAAMRWVNATQLRQVTRELASELNINAFSLAELGYPAIGAMFEARDGQGHVTRFVLR